MRPGRGRAVRPVTGRRVGPCAVPGKGARLASPPSPFPPQGDGSLDRIARTALAALLLVAMALPGAAAPVIAAPPVPKVVLVVGPVGDVITPRYRALADAAARVARQAGAQVVKVYSPNATWPAVRSALRGASIVVYLGHGNGWPSRYRDALYPPTQNGFGLNPVAGRDDSTHQYFGEASVDDVRLAPSAVVLLHHLCYASGNTEPGLPEGTRDQAIQRVDNYAAGFLRAGARAVVAEAHLGPAYYVGALLRGNRTIEEIWRSSPNARGNTFRLASVRSPGFVTRLDPDRPEGGYHRSLVSRGVTAAELRAGASGTRAPGPAGAEGEAQEVSVPLPPPEPSLASADLRFGETNLRGLPVAGASTRAILPLADGAALGLPRAMQASVRWDPILLDPAPGPPGSGAGQDPGPVTGPVEPPPVDLVVPERLGSLVSPVRAVRTDLGLRLDVTYPDVPGLYRLTTTLHAPDGTAYDAATQALLTPVLVRVGGPVAAAFGVSPAVEAIAGAPLELPVRVLNAGTERWDLETTAAPTKLAGAPDPALRTATLRARLVASWVSPAGQAVPEPVSQGLDAGVAEPGGEVSATLRLQAPAPGQYLLVLDVVSPGHGSLSALGSQPALVRVTVQPADPLAGDGSGATGAHVPAGPPRTD